MFLTAKGGLIMGPLAHLLGAIMNAIFNLLSAIGIQNIGICIIIFTIFVRLVMYPLSIKQTRSSKIQKFLQPEFNKISKKYRGKKDQQSMLKQQQETRELQAKYGIKLSSGCLTSLIQLPIFFSLYYVIQNIPAYVGKVYAYYENMATTINNAISNNSSLLGKYNDFLATNTVRSSYVAGNERTVVDALSKLSGEKIEALLQTLGITNNYTSEISNIDRINTFIGGINMTEAPGWKLTWALVIPILSFVFQYLSMNAMPMDNPADPQAAQSMQMMRTMTKIMPLFSLFICVTVPAGVGLYWAIGAMISYITTVLTNRYFDNCDMERVVQKAAEKAAVKNAKKKASGKKSFMDKLTEAATGANNEEATKDMNKITSTKLKNYSSATATSTSNTGNVKYKEGSIASKANIMKQYNEKGGKE